MHPFHVWAYTRNMSSMRPSASHSIPERTKGQHSSRRKTGWERALAVFGIIVGFAGGIIWGIIAWVSYSHWQSGRRDHPRFAWFAGIVGLTILVETLIAGLFTPEALDHVKLGGVGVLLTFAPLVVAAVGLLMLTRELTLPTHSHR